MVHNTASTSSRRHCCHPRQHSRQHRQHRHRILKHRTERFIEETAQSRAASLAFTESLCTSREEDVLDIVAIGQKYENCIALLMKGSTAADTLYKRSKARGEEMTALQMLNSGPLGEPEEIERLRQGIEKMKEAMNNNDNHQCRHRCLQVGVTLLRKVLLSILIHRTPIVLFRSLGRDTNFFYSSELSVKHSS